MDRMDVPGMQETTMRKVMTLLAGLAVLALLTAPVPVRAEEEEGTRKTKKAQRKTTTTKKEKAKKAKKAKPAQAEEVACFAKDMEKLTSKVGLTEEQQRKIQDLKATRDTALGRWDAANQKKMAAIEERLAGSSGGKSAKSRKRLERQLKDLKGGRETLAGMYERRMFAVLTQEQRGAWNGRALAEGVLKDLSRLNLDDKQTKQVRQLCMARGQRVPMPVDAARHESIFKAVEKQVYSTILTPDQRKDYAKYNRSARSTTPKKSTAKKSSRKKTTTKRK